MIFLYCTIKYEKLKQNISLKHFWEPDYFQVVEVFFVVWGCVVTGWKCCHSLFKYECIYTSIAAKEKWTSPSVTHTAMVCCMRVGTRTKVTVDELQLGLICSPFGPILFTKFWRASVDKRENVVIGGASDLWLTTTPESTKGALVLTHVSQCINLFIDIVFISYSDWRKFLFILWMGYKCLYW